MPEVALTPLFLLVPEDLEPLGVFPPDTFELTLVFPLELWFQRLECDFQVLGRNSRPHPSDLDSAGRRWLLVTHQRGVLSVPSARRSSGGGPSLLKRRSKPSYTLVKDVSGKSGSVSAGPKYQVAGLCDLVG
ncbi:hypothetical protein BKN51_21030 [Amycolatopsis sp. BJA-103]|nr:hypothetical protein BKN51_21030 [Amycolatopsis sp. BJA-103]